MPTTLTAVIIDDEVSAAKFLQKQLILFCPEVQVITTIHHPQEAITSLKQLSPDVIFLDIQMPGIDGFELLRQLYKPTFNVIFVTAYAEYAIQAIKARALDYLLKPVDEDELKKAVKNALELKEQIISNPLVRLQNQDLITEVANSKSSELIKDIWLKMIDGTKSRYPIETIYLFEADGDYSWVHFEKGDKKWTNHNLKSIEKTLSEHNFIRSHDKYLVNPIHINTYRRDEAFGLFTMQNGKTVPVSKGKRIMVEDKLRVLGLNW